MIEGMGDLKGGSVVVSRKMNQKELLNNFFEF